MNSNQGDEASIREAVGIFFDPGHLREAAEDLLNSGFELSELGLLAGERIVREALGDLYTRTNEFPDSARAPVTAFVEKESVGDTVRAISGSLFFIGTGAISGAVVASSAVLGGALLAAVGGAVGVGAVGALVSAITRQSDAEYLEEQVDQGHLLLFVRVLTAGKEELALEILSRHSGFDVRIHEVSPEARRRFLNR